MLPLRLDCGGDRCRSPPVFNHEEIALPGLGICFQATYDEVLYLYLHLLRRAGIQHRVYLRFLVPVLARVRITRRDALGQVREVSVEVVCVIYRQIPASLSFGQP